MAGSRALRKIQFGRETTAGSTTYATTIWRGTGVLHDQRDVIFPKEDVGILGGTTRSYIGKYWTDLTLDSVEATFEQLPYVFEAGVQTATATADGSGSGYIYVYTASVSAQNTSSKYSIEGGADEGAEEASYFFCKHFNLSGDGQGALFMTSDWVGRVCASTTFSATATIPDVEEILVNTGSLYIDNLGTTVGSTAVSGTLFAIDLDYTTGLQEFWAVDDSLDFNLVKFTEDEIILNLTYEHNASALTEKAKYQAGSVRNIRLKFEHGTAMTTVGTDYTYKTLIIDVAGVYEDWSVLQDQDGNDVVTATLRVRYALASGAAPALKFGATIVNELSALA